MMLNYWKDKEKLKVEISMLKDGLVCCIVLQVMQTIEVT